jgi:hypothetical protein
MRMNLGQVTLAFPEVTDTGGAQNTDTATGVSLAFPETNSASCDVSNEMNLTAAQLAACNGAACPCTSCSIVAGICDTNIYLAIAAVVAGFIFMGLSHK